MSAVPLPEIIAHRGNASEFPENTLEALESAVALGVKFVEFDVQLTADRVPVLLHDADLGRVADRPEAVHDIAWDQLADYPVGEMSRFGSRFASVKPPGLSQVASSLARWDGVTAFVEIKRSSIRKFGREVVLSRVLKVLQPVLDRCVLISFDLPCLKIARVMSNVQIGWVLTQYDDAAHAEARALAPEFLFANLERLPADDTPFWQGPWDWAIYEVRDLRTAQRCRDRGARFVETMTVRGMMSAYEESRRKW
jgi:glycerophosphoryl diester phosphodiesterase